MDQVNKKNKKDKKYPRVPIKTYRWEDIRRDRKRGGYPWTHLYKQPFDEEPDPEAFTMDALRKSKSSSTLGRSEGVVIADENKSDEKLNKADLKLSEPITDDVSSTIKTKEIETHDEKDNTDNKLEPENISEENIPEENTIRNGSKGTTPIKDDSEVLKKPDNHLQHEDGATSHRLQDTGEEEEIIDTTLMEDEDEEKDPTDVFDKLFEASASSVREQELETQRSKPVRSKSAEPERRRKLSLEKLLVTNKFKKSKLKRKRLYRKKETKTVKKPTPIKVVEPVYIHIPLKPQEGTTDEFSHLEFEDKTVPQIVGRKRSSSSTESPIQNEGVQFIYLTAPSDDEILDYHSSDVPETPSSETKVFFGNKIEELKELAKDVLNEISPPSKQLDTVDEETNSDKAKSDESSITSKKSEIVGEKNDDKTKYEIVSDGDKTKNEDGNKYDVPESIPTEALTVDISHTEEEKMMVDEEDGLNEAITKQDVVITKQEVATKPVVENNETSIMEDSTIKPSKNDAPALVPEVEKEITLEQPVDQKLKPTLKNETSPVIKKKVSFKRRSKTPKDGIYEDIQLSKASTGNENEEETKKQNSALTITTGQSMSVDEEKTYLDPQIIKTTSLEEDYNKWSKLNDHEYEPVNPPPDNETFPSPAPTIHIINIDQEPKYVQPITDIVITTPVDPIVKDEINNKPAATDTSMHIFTSATTVNDGQPPEPISSTNEKHKESPNKFQLAFKQKTEQLKLKLHNIKKPHITAPQKPKSQKVKTEKSKINFPKIPNTTKINLPSFNFGRRRSENRSLKQRQLSTESNAGDSKKPIFDFSTYPRIFKKKSKVSTGDDMDASPDFATVPRGSKKTKPGIQSETTVTWGGTDAIRIPLHPEEYFNAENEERMIETERESPEKVIDTREDSLERRMASHIRYDEDIDSEDEYERENHDINRDEFVNRWDYGNFNLDSNQEYLNNFKNSQYKVTDLDSPEDIPGQNEFRTNENKETYSSGSSLGMQRVGGVLEEIDSDEFFLRQKGISQDNIEVGMLLSSEIREAFRMPENALSKMQDPYERDFDHKGSNQSLPEARGKHKAIKKPKRKKTPHASQEKIPYVEESADEDLDVLPPSRPKRRSKRIKKLKNDDIIPYQETISLGTGHPERFLDHRESLGILGDDEREIENNAYENEVMEGKEQPEIKATDAYRSFELVDINKFNKDNSEERPAAPPRKQKSLKSLNLSEDGSIPEDINIQQYIADFNDEKMQTNAESVIPPSHQPPQRPIRMRSHTSSQSIITSTWDDESLKTENFDNQTPCVEEPCTREIVDYMGYAIIDKQKVRDPPLPPPRAPQRHKRSVKDKFFTVPRPAKGSDSPVRPLRNYSTLSQTKRNTEPATYENKENIDIMQYIESDDSNRNLQSGEILNKMKDRPLPAPPRPPRKSKPLQDITSKENISEISDEECKADFEEIEVSTQTEPLPEDFICEEVTQKASETILLPSNLKAEQDKGDVNQTKDAPTVKKEVNYANIFYS
ncbi:hypothetical protein NQ317_009178 [Molorchus minor]|uniref:Titin-like n=1 Tax=Molorchus minor TaxID=1323400 RepID=A0ABQ9J6E3_9CUCU|nr:hypothetical protein NQ317_009178 [Molorchus minor]